MKSAKELTEEWFERVWNGRKTGGVTTGEAAISELMCEKCVVDGLESPALMRQGFLNAHRAFNGVLESIDISIMEMVEENGKVIGHARLKAIHKKTRNQVDLIFSFSAVWEGGKIKGARNVVDFVTMLSQMDALDKSTMARAFQP